MLTRWKNARQQWGGTSQIIDQWLERRKQLISQFIALPTVEIATLEDKLSAFCNDLTDYLSSGHFEVYEKLLSQCSHQPEGDLQQMQEILPDIQSTTDAALDFNDNYHTFKSPTVQQIRELSFQLSNLGEVLEERFALEDQLIAVLHKTQQPTQQQLAGQ